MEKLIMINEIDGKNIHHLFTHKEVKSAIIRIIGKPKTDIEHDIVNKETEKAWRKLPQYKINKENHEELHKAEPIGILEQKDVLTKKKIEELVCGGIKNFEKDKSKVLENKSSLIKRIVGQIYGYLHNYDEDLIEKISKSEVKRE